MNVRIITASAGSGKTTRLSEVLEEAIGERGVRPERVVATTFTREAAAQLVERARSRLLAGGRGSEAHQLLAARIGTVNSVCGGLVSDFAFELGLSPELRVLDEDAAELALRRSLARVVSSAVAAELEEARRRFVRKLDWRHEVRKLIEASRANRISSEALRRCARRSIETLDGCLGGCEPGGEAIDDALLGAIERALRGIDLEADRTKGTARYVDLLERCGRDLERRRLPWGDWAKLGSASPTKRSLVWAEPVMEAAARHLGHPGLRSEMHRFIERLYAVAADGLDAYRQYKRERGLIDYVDQETLALDLLERPAVQGALAGQIELVLVDEFQDTSPLQLAIFLELARLAPESVWVGDPKQAIFAFRGTDPALMDAAIESLSSPSSDPELVESATRALGAGREVETLGRSFRSRPELVHVTSDIFAPAFAAQGIPEERTRLEPALAREPEGLGPVIEVWPLEEATSNATRPAALAAGVKALLGRAPMIRDLETGAPRPAAAGDVAVLCRTNAQCQSVADELGALGIAAVVPRMRLLETAEGQLVCAGLRLWLDPRDSLAAAQVARLVSYPETGEGFLERLLEAPGAEAFADDPVVARIVEARRHNPDLGVLGAFDAVLEATGAHELACAWGGSDQRRANLDALRAHVADYVEAAAAGREAATLSGLFSVLDEMIDESGWYSSRSDSQALLGGADAVTVSTWHRAKGLEWPVTVLFGLEKLREPDAFGVRVVSDIEMLDIDEPLAGRWVRFWPNPYSTSNQKGPVKEAYEASPAFAEARDKSHREALRVLYVGWTRARDRLVLAGQKGKLLGGILGRLTAIDEGLIGEPTAEGAEPQVACVSWAKRELEVLLAAAAPAEPESPAPRPGSVIEGLANPPDRAPARLSPSEAEALPARLGEIVRLGPRIPLLRRLDDVTPLGDAVHGFLAADDPEGRTSERRERAAALLRGFGVADVLSPLDVVVAADRLWTWLEARFEMGRIEREVPVAHRLEHGTVVSGAADLVVRLGASFVLIDHKTFPGSFEVARERVLRYSGQLATYGRALEAATGERLESMWIHLPILGTLIEICIYSDSEEPVS